MSSKSEDKSVVVGPDNVLPPQVLSSQINDTDLEVAEQTPLNEDDDSMYNRFSSRRKALFSFILALCGILAPLATTGCLTAVPDIARTFHTSGSIINVSNGLYTGAMGISAFIWGVTSSLSGRKVVLLSSVTSFFFFSLGCALSPNLAAFFAFRTLSGFSGTGLLVCGPAVIGDLYKPVSPWLCICKIHFNLNHSRQREPRPWLGL